MFNLGFAKKSQRRVLRERALQILYAFEMTGEGLTNIMNGSLSDISSVNDREFCHSLVNKAVANHSQLDEFISQRVNNWEMDRIALLDKILLRIGIAELLYFPDIPPKVTINEIIEIAKEYSTSNSGKFLNGILDAILSDLKTAGKLKKMGRGLLEQSVAKKAE